MRPASLPRRSTSRKSASATMVARPCPIRQCATSRSRADVAATPQRPRRSRPGRRSRRAWRAWARARPGASSLRPQWPSRPVSANIGGGRSGSPSGRSLCHSSIGSASSSTRPPPRTQSSSATRSSAGWAQRMRHQQEPAPGEVGLVGDADRNHAVARRKRFQSGRTAGSSENCSLNTSGRLVRRRSVGRSAGARGGSGAGCRRASA